MATAHTEFDKGRWFSLFFLLAGLLTTGFAYWQGKQLVEREQSSQLDARAQDAKNNLERKIGEYTEVLRGYQAQFAAHPDLTRQTFRHVTDSLQLEQRLPGIQAVGFSPRVVPSERRRFETLLHREYLQDPQAFVAASVAPQTRPDADAFMVRYIEPAEKNRFRIGYDHAAEAKRQVAIYRARDTGELAVSERVRLFVAPGTIDGIVFFLPLYEGGGIPATLESRRERFSGFVFLAIRTDEMLRKVFGPDLLGDLDIDIHHVRQTGNAIKFAAQDLLFDSRNYRPAASIAAASLQRRLELPVGGMVWQLSATAQPQFARQSQAWLPPIAAFAGALLSLLAFFFMRLLNSRHRTSEARASAVERSLHSSEKKLTEVMKSIDQMLWTADFPEGKISYVSPAVERVYGWPASDFYNNHGLWLACIHPEDRERVKAFALTAAERAKSGIDFRIVRPDGMVRWLRYAIHFVADGATPGTGQLNSVGSDITDEYLLQESLRRSHRALRAIHECEEKIAVAEDEHALLQGICEVVVKTGYRMAWIGLLRTDGGAGITLTNIAGESQSYMESIERPLSEDLSRLVTIDQALRTRRPATASNFAQDRHLPWRAAALQRGFHSKAALPLIHGERIIGILNVYATEEDAFDAEELGLLEGLAHSVMAALQSLRDRSRRKAAEAALHLRQRAIEASANAIVITSAARPDYPVEYVNPAFERMTGYRADEIVGQSLRILRGGDDAQSGIAEIRAILSEQREGDATVRNYRKDGTLFWSKVYIAPVRDDAGTVSHFVAAKYDVTETRHYQDTLEFQASHDALTGLPNRTLLHDRLALAVAAAARYGQRFWVAFLDLDHFKFINDSLGHSAGDVLLQQIATRLQHALRESDTVARQGGDEFVLILPEQDEKVPNAHVLQRIMEVITQPLAIDSHRFYPTCSIGIAIYPADGEDAETLIKHADIAMYRAKEIGRNNFQFFTPALNEKALERLRLETDLRKALERDELVLHYQPQVSLHSGRIVGMEALIRWQHPQLGMVAPGRFIALAEETGLIVPIGQWVLRTACRQTRAWQEAGLATLRIAVNLSARQFGERDLVQSITAILAETGLDAQLLELELTEGMVMEDVERTIGILHELKALGLHLSIDDFGTGYSSLSYLKRFPIDVLKIDQSFVRDMTANADSAAIVKAIISLARNLRLQVIAEGVETESQLAYLRENDCSQMQGYYFSRPLAADAFEEILRQGKMLKLD
jgi:diguanylate cyclase (GGDEF)-like protein/PAS domain S-box-containing protein